MSVNKGRPLTLMASSAVSSAAACSRGQWSGPIEEPDECKISLNKASAQGPLRASLFELFGRIFARWRAEALLALTTMTACSQRVELRAA